MRRVQLAALLLLSLITARAQAHSIGSIFSSAVDGDSAALYWNPAAMGLSPTSRVDVVANIGILAADYQRAGLDTAQTGRPFPKVSLIAARPEPQIGIIIDRLYKKRLRLGFSFSVPLASGAGWPEKMKENGAEILGPTRYHATEGFGFSAYAQFGASFELHRMITVGASLNLVTSYLVFNKHLDLLNQTALTNTTPCQSNPFGCENPNFSTPFQLEARGFMVGGTFGLLFRPIPRLRLGFAYATPINIPMSATAKMDSDKLEAYAQQFFPSFQPLNVNGSGHFTIVIPQRIHTAIAWDITPKVQLMFSFNWIDSSVQPFVTGQLTQKGSTLLPDSLAIAQVQRDTYQFSGRFQWRITQRWTAGFLVEYLPNTRPGPYVSPAGIDYDSVVFNLSARFLIKPWVALGATFGQYLVIPRDIAVSAFANDRPAPFNLPDPTGHWGGNGERAGLDVSFFF